MKNIFAKLFALGKHQVEQAGEAVVNYADIRTQGAIIIKNIEKRGNEIIESVNDAQTMVIRCKNDNERLAEKIRLNNEKAVRWVKAGDDEKAANALADVELLEGELKNNEKIIESLEPVVKQQLAFVKNLNNEKKRLEADIRKMDATEKMYKAKNDMIGGVSNTSPFNISELRDRVEKLKANVEAKEYVHKEVHGASESEEAAEQQSLSVQDRLAKLKEQVAADQE